MSITMIAAMGRNRTIGKDNKLPWKLPEDMAYFKRMTTGQIVVMGRSTLESFGGALKNREANVVITRNRDYACDGCRVVYSAEEALDLYPDRDVMIIGGEQIYRLFLPHADKVLLTEIEAEFDGDAFFPELPPDQWELQEKTPGETNEKNPYAYAFCTYIRPR
ncbi:dihydrofolate reductase [Paenibacillus sp. IB182496]|uniref:Dihydrofolate reductase n=1 Tax=Paenibacillus sabuli TaxID=2772509 RepID=A0A927BY88_9BACL|nr:dihydrofolate reductase [Paenibacillus sabuli]MBD2847940.1 dihydrofolate reductase [Paenibacillus sabuli]